MPLDPVTLGIASSVVTGIFGGGAARRAVSYTHLTLPTKA